MIDLRLGDSLKVLRTIRDSSIDSVVTDPPYGISLIGKKWDYEVPSQDLWTEVLRVLKPGGHLLSFSATRTFHRMAVKIEDAGFEIRDQICWIYGSGFPKSTNQLRPSLEPIVLARRSPVRTVKDNLDLYGTGSLNIDGCRIGDSGGTKYDGGGIQRDREKNTLNLGMKNGTISKVPGLGRWPANVIFDGSEEAVEGLGHASRYFYIPKASKKDRGEGNTHPTVKPTDLMKYLVRLITPEGGIVLDPFMGSGTTGVAAKSEGFSFLGIEREPDYLEIAKARIHASD